ncbi:MAG: hypothetical protein Q8O43_04360 [Dehalococcoidia bacterium]|nr:hypothetical protein [Dehalococcoidia bacterium]
MGSRVVGFRVPDDLAEELERVSDERGQTTAEFLRKLVDDALYPSKSAATLKDEDGDDVTLSDLYEQLQGHEANIKENYSDIAALQKGIKTLGERLDKLDGLRNTDTSSIVRMVNDLHESQLKGLLNLTKTVDTNAKVHRSEIEKIQKMIEGLSEGQNEVKTKLTTHGHDDLKPIPALVTKVANLEGVLGTVQSKVEYLANVARRQPTGETMRLGLTDGKEHIFRIYKSSLGLTRPHHKDEFLGDGYWVDLSEPDK